MLVVCAQRKARGKCARIIMWFHLSLCVCARAVRTCQFIRRSTQDLCLRARARGPRWRSHLSFRGPRVRVPDQSRVCAFVACRMHLFRATTLMSHEDAAPAQSVNHHYILENAPPPPLGWVGALSQRLFPAICHCGPEIRCGVPSERNNGRSELMVVAQRKPVGLNNNYSEFPH